MCIVIGSQGYILCTPGLSVLRTCIYRSCSVAKPCCYSSLRTLGMTHDTVGHTERILFPKHCCHVLWFCCLFSSTKLIKQQKQKQNQRVLCQRTKRALHGGGVGIGSFPHLYTAKLCNFFDLWVRYLPRTRLWKVTRCKMVKAWKLLVLCCQNSQARSISCTTKLSCFHHDWNNTTAVGKKMFSELDLVAFCQRNRRMRSLFHEMGRFSLLAKHGTQNKYAPRWTKRQRWNKTWEMGDDFGDFRSKRSDFHTEDVGGYYEVLPVSRNVLLEMPRDLCQLIFGGWRANSIFGCICMIQKTFFWKGADFLGMLLPLSLNIPLETASEVQPTPIDTCALKMALIAFCAFDRSGGVGGGGPWHPWTTKWPPSPQPPGAQTINGLRTTSLSSRLTHQQGPVS